MSYARSAFKMINNAGRTVMSKIPQGVRSEIAHMVRGHVESKAMETMGQGAVDGYQNVVGKVDQCANQWNRQSCHLSNARNPGMQHYEQRQNYAQRRT